MARPNNILNQKKDADRRLDIRIKQGVAATVGFTLLYLYAAPVGESGEQNITLFDFISKGLTPKKILIALLILNTLMLARLGWRIFISCRYNKHYDDAEKEICDEKISEDEHKKAVNKRYKEKAKCLTCIDKYIMGLGVPIIISFIAIAWLFYAMGKVN